MKRVLILMFLFAILVTSLFAQEESGNSSLFPEQIVFPLSLCLRLFRPYLDDLPVPGDTGNTGGSVYLLV